MPRPPLTLAVALGAAAVVAPATAHADELADEAYGQWRHPGKLSWELAVEGGPGFGYDGYGFAGSRLAVSGGFRYLVDPPPRSHGDFIEAIFDAFGRAALLALIGNQYGADLRASWLYGLRGRHWVGADVSFTALAVLPLAPDTSYPPRFNAVLNGLPGVGFLVSETGDPALQIPVDIPVAFLIHRHAGIELTFTTSIVVGADGLPPATAYITLGTFVR